MTRGSMNKENFDLVGAELERESMTPQEREARKQQMALLESLERTRISVSMEMKPIEHLYRICNKPCFPRGEIVTVSGKAKSGKTSFLSLLMAIGCMSETQQKEVGLGIERIPETLLKILWYDTEQSRQSTYEILSQRIKPLVEGTDRKDDNSRESVFPEEMFDVFNSRGIRWEQRMSLLVAAIEHCHPDLVVVDGICDLVADINDGVSVKPVVERLMAIAQAQNCCIVCVIHQNKAADDRNPRGWLGTELNNKSFETYACELLKPEMIFSVEQTLSRRYRMDGNYYFTIDDLGMPHVAQAPENIGQTDPHNERKKDYPPMNDAYLQWDNGVMTVDLRSLFYDALKNGARYYSDLQATAMELLQCKDTGYWNSLFLKAKNQRIIVNSHNGQGKSVWTLPRKAEPAELRLPGDDFGGAPPF